MATKQITEKYIIIFGQMLEKKLSLVYTIIVIKAKI